MGIKLGGFAKRHLADLNLAEFESHGLMTPENGYHHT